MRKISLWLLVFTFAAFASGVGRAQDAATQQLIDEINGRIQNLTEMQAAQGKRIDALEKSVGDLSDKLNQPAINNSASADDLKKLATQVQELAKKQQADNDLIVKELEKLAKGGGVSAPAHRTPEVSTAAPPEVPTPAGPQKGYYYSIAAGDTVMAISKAYRAQGVKVTSDQILKANPGLDAKNLIVGKKIFIPDANAK